MTKSKIYFDNSATTPVDPQVLKAMTHYFSDIFGNASSIHTFGQEAVFAVDDAREKVADFLNCKTGEIIFTSGATESDNIAIQGIVKSGEHIITSKIEHPAILETCRAMEKRGVDVTYLDVNSAGLISVDDVASAIKDNTKLISIMYVNNEIGTTQSICDIGKLVKIQNELRKSRNLGVIYFHTDAVQAANYCDMNVENLGVDLLSLSAHKIYGPKGIGVLYRKTGINIQPIQFGGHHEYGIRPGTINVPGIVGLGKAVELLLNQDVKAEQNLAIKILRDNLIQEIKKIIPKTQINGDMENRIPANAHFSFYGVEGESMLLLLDQAGLAVSTGSACSSGSLEPSHVLMALGMDPLLAHGSLRITLGKFNTQKDIDYLIKELPLVVSRLRKMSPIN